MIIIAQIGGNSPKGYPPPFQVLYSMTEFSIARMLTLPLLADNLIRKLQDSLSVLSPELIPIHGRLVNIRRQLVALAAKETAREVALANAHAERVEDLKGKAVATDDSVGSDPNSRTPTRESTPKPPGDSHSYRDAREKDGIRVKAELKPIQEELRKIDS